MHKIVPNAAHIKAIAKFETVEGLIAYLFGTVQEWQHESSKVLAIAFAGRDYCTATFEDEDTVAANLFDVISDSEAIGGTSYAQSLMAGIARLQQLAAAPGAHGKE